VAGLLSFHVDQSIGREQEWNRIVEFCATRQPGYLLVESPGGFGKSTFVAQVLVRRETSQWPEPAPNVLFFFVRSQGARNTPAAFLEAVNSQLLDLLDLGGGVPSRLEQLRAQFSELWSTAVTAAGREFPLLLLVDGLDEMASGTTTIADLLPGGLRDHVHVVITSRPNPAARELVNRDHPLRIADELALETFDDLGIELLLQRFGTHAELVTQLAPAVRRLTRGEPLFARFVAEEVGSEGTVALERLEANPPADVDEYFSDQLHSLDEAADGDISWDLLGLLTVALGSLRPGDLGEALQRPLRAIRGALEPIDRFLIGDDAVELFHRNFQALLEERFTDQEREAYRDRLIGWCASYQEAGWPEKTPEYALAHYAEHLRDAGTLDALCALPDGHWLRRHRENTGSFAGFARDVEMALVPTDSGQALGLAQEIRLCLVAATVGALSTSVPASAVGVLAATGRETEAEARAGLVHDPLWRSATYRHLAGGLARRGDDHAAKLALARAVEAIARGRYHTGSYDTSVLEGFYYLTQEVAALARALSDARDFSGLEHLLIATDAFCTARYDGRGSVAFGFALAGRAATAVEIGRELIDAAEALRASGDTPSPRDPFVGIAVAPEALLATAARILATAGEIAFARELAKDTVHAIRTEVPSYRQAALLSTWAGALADGGLHDEAQVAGRHALAAAKRVEGQSAVGALRVAAEALDALGDEAALEELFRGADAGADSLMVALAAGFAHIGRTDRALAALERIENDISRSEATPSVARGLAAASNVETALSVAAAAPAQWGKTRALAGVAEELLSSGELAEAAKTADRAIRESERPDWDDNRTIDLLAKIASALRDVGAHERGLAVVDRMLELVRSLPSGKRIPATTSLAATALASSGRVDEALELAEFPDIPALEATTLSAIGEAAHHAGRSDVAGPTANRVRAFAEATGSTGASLEVLIAFSRLLAVTGQTAEAEKVIYGEAVPLILSADPSAVWPGPADPALAVALELMGHHNDAVAFARRGLDAWSIPPVHWYRREPLAQALSLLPRDEAEGWVHGLSEKAGKIESDGDEHEVFATLAVAWYCVGRSTEAVAALRAAVRDARLTGFRQRLFEVLGDGSSIVASVDAGQTLWETYEALVDIDGWWE
jgi:tetratricopeptide (TPR) repeat protein